MMNLLFNKSLKNVFLKKSTTLNIFNSVGSHKKFTRWDLNITNHDEISHLKLNKHCSI